MVTTYYFGAITNLFDISGEIVLSRSHPQATTNLGVIQVEISVKLLTEISTIAGTKHSDKVLPFNLFLSDRLLRVALLLYQQSQR